ncbi:MAG: hypothetical protein ABL958_17590 [Bdellovibrionia bacterium]
MTDFMSPFPQLKKICAGRWKLWEQQLAKEVGGEVPHLQSYLPMWLRKNSVTVKVPPFWFDLAEYEWSVHFVREADHEVVKPGPLLSSDLLRVNPFIRILKLSYDIKGWIHSGALGEPKTKAHMMVITGKARFEASFDFAAIIDELQDGPLTREDLEKNLIGKIGPRDWTAPILTLYNGGGILK